MDIDIFEQIANEKIKEAIERGEFDNLPGKGKPLDLEEDANVPPDLRLAYRIMKNAGVAPPEVSLRKELNNLKKQLAAAKTNEERQALEREVRLMCLRISLLTEPRQSKRRR
ncbi:MAG: DUF1992 domain-containing protein [Acidobacteriota bacterium]